MVSGDGMSPSAAGKVRVKPRMNRWEDDGMNLKHALSSVNLAGNNLLKAYHAAATDSRSSRQMLEYSLDQAALARALLDDFLFRHGRDGKRGVLDGVHIDDAAEADHNDLRRQKRTEQRVQRRDRNKRYGKERYQRLVAEKLCVSCGAPAKEGSVFCTTHVDMRKAAYQKRKTREHENIKAMSKVRATIGAK